VHALVFFKGPVRTENGDRVRFRLLAVLPDQLGCAPASDEIERPLPASTALQDLDSRLTKIVEDVIRDPVVTEVTVCPFENAGAEFSACAPVLTDLVLKHLDDARRSYSALWTNRTISIKRAEPGRCAAAGATAQGQIGAESDGKRLWIKLDFTRDAELLATTGRTPVFPQDLGCEARLRSFFDFIRAPPRASRSQN
jgi:hypothetical protein